MSSSPFETDSTIDRSFEPIEVRLRLEPIGAGLATLAERDRAAVGLLGRRPHERVELPALLRLERDRQPGAERVDIASVG